MVDPVGTRWRITLAGEAAISPSIAGLHPELVGGLPKHREPGTRIDFRSGGTDVGIDVSASLEIDRGLARQLILVVELAGSAGDIVSSSQ